MRAEFTRDETAASRQLQAYNKSVEQLDLNKREIRRQVPEIFWLAFGSGGELTSVAVHQLRKPRWRRRAAQMRTRT